jgi:hypothetical protein
MLDGRAVSMKGIVMKRSRTGSIVIAAIAGLVGAASVAWAQLAGVITHISPRNVTVSGAVYALEKETRFEDMSRHEIAFSELRPGVQVELEFDAEGLLSLIRASVVR